jgi:N-acetylglucosaminyl-diphospho-decaprenol L-rhamnosyltransferase
MREHSAKPASLIVVHWNRPEECIATVRAFLDQRVPLSVVVLDNNSTEEAFRTVSAELANAVRFIRLSENRGWGGALNVALEEWLRTETNPYCLIAAHDALPSPDCVKRLIEAADGDERIGIACPEYPDGSVARLSALRGVYQEMRARLTSGEVQFVDVPHGTLMLVRRACLSAVGLFDERYFAYGDEHELGARTVRRGWKIALAGGAVVSNPDTWTPSALRSYLFARNSLLLVRDYYGLFAALTRALLIIANTFKLLVTSRDRAFAFSARARFRGVRDFVRGRFGRPSDIG